MGGARMCLTLASLAAATGLQAYGQYKQSRNEEKALNFQAGMAREDAAAAEYASEVTAGNIRKAAELTRKSAAASYGASGVDVRSGTALDVQADILRRGEYDALTELISGANAKRRLLQQGELYSRGAKNVRTTGNINALSTVLGGAAKAGWAYGGAGGGGTGSGGLAL